MGVRSQSQWNHLETQVETEPWGSYGYWTLVFFIQIENLSCVNFLTCVVILFHESVQIVVLRFTVIAGKQSWNLRWWLSGQCSFDIYQRFFSVLYPSCTDVTISSAPDNREWFLGLKTPDLDNDQFSVSFFPWHKRVIFYFIFLPMSCCLNGNNITDMRDRLLWWIAWATEPMWGEYQQPTKREKTNRAGTSRWLGYTSIKNVCQTPNRRSRGSFYRHILCIVWC